MNILNTKIMTGTELRKVFSENKLTIREVAERGNLSMDHVRRAMTQPHVEPPTDPDFERLKRLFWAIPSGEERFVILDSVTHLAGAFGALTEIPRGTENLRLGLVEHLGLQDELWQAVMARLPESQREANPFIRIAYVTPTLRSHQ
jgi:hypothetical protein